MLGRKGSSALALAFEACADFQFGMFYLGPQLGYRVVTSEEPLSTDSKTLTASLETGVRISQFEGFLRYNLTDEDDEYTPSTLNSSEKSNVITAGVSFRF